MLQKQHNQTPRTTTRKAHTRKRPVVRTQRNLPRSGFTLVEILVVIAIIAILIGLLLPGIQRARLAAQRTSCSNNFRQVSVATLTYASATGNLPPLMGTNGNTCLTAILPNLEQADLYSQGTTASPGWFTTGATPAPNYAGTPVKAFLCPSDSSVSTNPNGVNAGGYGVTNYSPNFQVFGYTGGGDVATAATGPANWSGHKFPDDVPDGTASTVMFSERLALCNGVATAANGNPSYSVNTDYTYQNWFAYGSGATAYTNLVPGNMGLFQVLPSAATCNGSLANSPHPGGIGVAMCDGSSRFFSPTMSVSLWQALLTPAGHEIISTTQW